MKNALKSKTILIVDDTTTNIDLLFEILEPHGCRLSFATSGEMALEKVEKIDPDLILLDVKMPGIDGFETCSRLKKMSTVKDIPVIFVTALSDGESIAKGFSMGGVDYITKPIKKLEVEARVQTQLKLLDLFEFQEGVIDTLENALSHGATGFMEYARNLRSPLTAIKGYGELLKEQAQEQGLDAFEQGQQVIVDTCNQMARVIEGLQDLARLDTKTMPVFEDEFSVNTTLKYFQSTLDNMTNVNNNQLLIEELAEDVVLHNDSEKINKILYNITENAYKYTENGTIIIRAEVKDNFVCVHIIDNGQGIAPDQVASLFSRLDSSSNQIFSKSGLGLLISQRLCNIIGGYIEVDSELGEGSTVKVYIPRKLPEDRIKRA